MKPDAPSSPTNPYEPPISDVKPTWLDRLRQWWRGTVSDPFADPSLPEFLDGHILMYDGVMFFFDPAEDWNLHLAIGIEKITPENLQRNEMEVRRVVKNFVDHYPEHAAAVTDRDVRLRFISSYRDLESEVADRIGLGRFSELLST
jgi:hypothetical protein